MRSARRPPWNSCRYLSLTPPGKWAESRCTNDHWLKAVDWTCDRKSPEGRGEPEPCERPLEQDLRIACCKRENRTWLSTATSAVHSDRFWYRASSEQNSLSNVCFATRHRQADVRYAEVIGPEGVVSALRAGSQARQPPALTPSSPLAAHVTLPPPMRGCAPRRHASSRPEPATCPS